MLLIDHPMKVEMTDESKQAMEEGTEQDASA